MGFTSTNNLEKEVAYCVCPKDHKIAWERYNFGKEQLDNKFFEAGKVSEKAFLSLKFGKW